MNEIYTFINSVLLGTTPIMWAALGCLFAHRAGIYQLGLEGLMLIGAFASIGGALAFGSAWAGIALAIAVCVLMSALFWLVVVILKANAIIAGLGLVGVGVGGTSFLQNVIFHTSGAVVAKATVPSPVPGTATGPAAILASLSLLVYLMPIAAIVVWLIARRSTFGLRVAATGQYPFAANAAGVKVQVVQLLALCIAGAMAAIGGSELSVGSLHAFSYDMTAGVGYVAFTAVLFGKEAPWGVVVASLVFGVATALGIFGEIHAVFGLPLEFLQMTPYVVTILALWFAGWRWPHAGNASAGAFAELQE
ncbi:MAG: ABC transporter permease [Actinobacteria bacterium]|nr:ABC transporter permease [Actinomycetota bacterium]MCL5446132.1 ABC transporter permease [Actinomycetota bacterium]